MTDFKDTLYNTCSGIRLHFFLDSGDKPYYIRQQWIPQSLYRNPGSHNITQHKNSGFQGQTFECRKKNSGIHCCDSGFRSSTSGFRCCASEFRGFYQPMFSTSDSTVSSTYNIYTLGPCVFVLVHHPSTHINATSMNDTHNLDLTAQETIAYLNVLIKGTKDQKDLVGSKSFR